MQFDFTFPTTITPQQVIAALVVEMERRADIVRSRQPGTTGVKASARLAGELDAINAVKWMLNRVVFRD